jgi:hypothetical protein
MGIRAKVCCWKGDAAAQARRQSAEMGARMTMQPGLEGLHRTQLNTGRLLHAASQLPGKRFDWPGWESVRISYISSGRYTSSTVGHSTLR